MGGDKNEIDAMCREMVNAIDARAS